MLSKLVFLVGALQAAFTSATITDRALNSDTRISHWLQNNPHEKYNGAHSKPHYDSTDNASLGNNIQTRQTSVNASGNAVFSNRCPYDAWIWSVDQNSGTGPILVPARTRYTEPFRQPCDGCGVSLKVSKTDQLLGGQQTQFEYAIAGGAMWYDISLVDCAQGESADNCPGHEKGLAIDSPELACGRFECAAGTYCPTQAYYVDQPLLKLGIPEPVLGCGASGTGMDIYFKLCSDEAPLKRSVAGRIKVDDDEF